MTGRMSLRRTAIGIVAALAVALAGGTAFAQSAKTSKPRSQVDDIPGDYIQLETLWVPVLNQAGRAAYLGMVVRLWPGGQTRYEACVKAPWMGEALLIHFNDHPLDRATYEDDKRLNKLVAAVIEAEVGTAVYRKSHAFREFVVPDEESAMLTLACK